MEGRRYHHLFRFVCVVGTKQKQKRLFLVLCCCFVFFFSLWFFIKKKMKYYYEAYFCRLGCFVGAIPLY